MLNRSLIAFLILLASCAQQADLLEVDVLKIRSVELADPNNAAMARGDQNYTLYGKLSAKERQLALGQYYTISRKETTDPAIVKFYYMQVESKSKKMVKTATLQPGQKRAEFDISGKSYLTKGRVLAWRAELYQNGVLLDAKQSYMWK